MSSGSKGGRAGGDKNHSTKTESSSNTNSSMDKKMRVATADQIRLAQITETNQDHALKANIEQVIDSLYSVSYFYQLIAFSLGLIFPSLS